MRKSLYVTGRPSSGQCGACIELPATCWKRLGLLSFKKLGYSIFFLTLILFLFLACDEIDRCSNSILDA